MKCMIELRSPDAVHYTAPHTIFHGVLKHSIPLSESIILLCCTEHLAGRCSLNHSLTLFPRFLFLWGINEKSIGPQYDKLNM